MNDLTELAQAVQILRTTLHDAILTTEKLVAGWKQDLQDAEGTEPVSTAAAWAKIQTVVKEMEDYLQAAREAERRLK